MEFPNIFCYKKRMENPKKSMHTHTHIHSFTFTLSHTHTAHKHTYTHIHSNTPAQIYTGTYTERKRGDIYKYDETHTLQV